MRAAIIGATGYGGAELIRLLHNHPHIQVSSVHSSSQQGTSMGQAYPHLQQVTNLQLEEIEASIIKEKADIVFLSTPPGVSAKISSSLVDEGLKIVDLSGDLRLSDKANYERWYQLEGAPEELLKEAVYGLTEWAKEEVKAAQVISNPGCYPTATLLGLAPLVKGNLVDPKTIIIDAKSGTSGAGRTASAMTHYSEMNENFKIYKVNEHKHIPEIEQQLQRWNSTASTVTFSTHLVPMVRGIMATIYASATTETTEEQLRDLYQTAYENSPFVRVRKQSEFPSTKEVFGTNFCDIGITYDNRTGRITVVSVIDNLVKGAAGQAIQNANVLFGFEEKAGLDLIALYP